jgi:hypothetical protein
VGDHHESWVAQIILTIKEGIDIFSLADFVFPKTQINIKLGLKERGLVPTF